MGHVTPITEHPDVQRMIMETTKLQIEKDRLLKALQLINDGFKHEYGHSDADRYNQDLLHWSKIASKALNEVRQFRPELAR